MNLLNAIEKAAASAKKPLSGPERNLITKLESFGVELPAIMHEMEKPLYRRNPFGGGSEVTLEAAALYDFCIESYKNYLRDFQFSYRGHRFPIAVYDRTRYIVLKIWPDVYGALLD